MSRFKPLYFSVFVVVFFAGILLAQQYLQQTGSDLIPGMGGDFVLESNNGPVSLKQFKGQVVGMYFGYMSCPDICPTALWSLTEAINLLDQQQQQSFQGLFISVDIERDSALALDIYARGYNENFLGLTADTTEQINKVARQYGVIYEKVLLKDSAMGYVVDHSSLIYLIDQQGVLRYRIEHGSDPAIIAEKIRELIEK